MHNMLCISNSIQVVYENPMRHTKIEIYALAVYVTPELRLYSSFLFQFF